MNKSVGSPNHQKSRQARSKRGNVLAFVVAVTLGIMIVIAIFSLKYERIIGTNQEQTTAIEAATFAAAKDLSKIVIEDPYYGFVSLSDYAPVGKNTVAGDNFDLHAQSINTVLATVRLDAIVADYMQDPIMKQCVQNDYQAALSAKDALNSELQQAANGGTGVDIDGNVLSPVNDAVKAYKDNLVRMTGGKSQLIQGSLKLVLGFEDAVPSNIPIPQPTSVANVSSNQQQLGLYKANTDVPYGGMSFVFASLERDTALVDHQLFKASESGLPYSIPSIVQCSADHFYQDRDVQGRTLTRTIHAVATAVPGMVRDQRPAPGAFTITVQAGPIPEIQTMANLFTQGMVMECPCDSLQTPRGGDYPADTGLSTLGINWLPDQNKNHPQMGELLSIAFHDWVRRAGINVNVKSLMDALHTPLKNPGGAVVVHEYQMTPQGNVSYSAITSPTINLPVSQNQWRAIGGLGFYSTSNSVYDTQITDFVWQEGRPQGGKHAGEPLDGKAVAHYDGGRPIPDFVENITLPYSAFTTGPAGGAVRPTYQTTGTAVDFTFRLRAVL